MADDLTPEPETRDAYREEVTRALGEDPTRLGDVWQRSDQDAGAIARDLEVATSGFVFSYRTYIRAIEEGTLRESPTLAGQCASTIRGFVKRHAGLSPESVSILQARADECERRKNDPVRRATEEQEYEQQTRAAERDGISGIYVYTLPHYLRYPVEASEHDETSDRTYLKVGMSESDVIRRFRQQRGSTELPEPPILLRIYVGPDDIDIREIEKKIHSHLNAADHIRNSERGAGREWFLTHRKFLDSTAGILGLNIHLTNDD
ncbi:MAG: GIY-YIG nuclease family protein [Candidatus Tectomicrobia bacterium]|nr:GIY-YIG nuclease family protein [Candidatus Tectomicrobia bacterium]